MCLLVLKYSNQRLRTDLSLAAFLILDSFQEWCNSELEGIHQSYISLRSWHRIHLTSKLFVLHAEE